MLPIHIILGILWWNRSPRSHTARPVFHIHHINMYLDHKEFCSTCLSWNSNDVNQHGIASILLSHSRQYSYLCTFMTKPIQMSIGIIGNIIMTVLYWFSRKIRVFPTWWRPFHFSDFDLINWFVKFWYLHTNAKFPPKVSLRKVSPPSIWAYSKILMNQYIISYLCSLRCNYEICLSLYPWIRDFWIDPHRCCL